MYRSKVIALDFSQCKTVLRGQMGSAYQEVQVNLLILGKNAYDVSKKSILSSGACKNKDTAFHINSSTL